MLDQRIGQQLERYRLTRLLGVGGFAKVYLGENVYNNKEFVAIKVMDATVTDQEEMDSFVNEVKKLASLKHPHIVKILNYNVEGNIAYLIMEYAPNGTLAQKHKDKVSLPFPTIARYVKEVASALQYVHERGLVHCDVKPANLLLGVNDEVILGDFGIVTATRTTAAPTLEHVHGTAPYMAPEQIDGRPVRATDQYSLGIMVYQWLTGELPFRGSPDAILQQHKFTAPPPLRRNDARLSLSIERVVRKALEKEPKDRYSNIQEFATALENALPVTQILPKQTNPLFPHSPNGQSPDGVLHVSPVPGYEGTPGDFTVRDSQAFLPIPSTPPELPIHPWMQRQYQIFTRFRALRDEYARRREVLKQQYDQDIKEADQKKIWLLGEVERKKQGVSQHINELHSYLHMNSWDKFIRNSTRLMRSVRLLKPPTSLQITSSTDYAEKMASYGSLYDEYRRKIRGISGLYNRPRNLVYTCIVIAAVSVLLLSFLLSGHVAIFNIDALLGFVIISLSCLYPQALWLSIAYLRVQWIEHLVQEAYSHQCDVINYGYSQKETHLKTAYDANAAMLQQQLREQMSEPLSAFSALRRDLGYTGVEWRDRDLWDQWKPTLHSPEPVTRIGSLIFDLYTGPIVFPALAPCPLGCNIVFQVEGTAKDQAVSAVQSLILRLLASQQPGKVHFTFIDPEKLGGNVKPFFSLPNATNILGTDKPWYHNQDIKQQLRKLIDYIAHAKNIDGPIETYHVLVVMDFPAKFTPEAAEDLLRIARNGPQKGISTILVVDIAQGLSAFDQHLQSLEKGSIVITWDGENQRFVWQDSPFQGTHLVLDAVPPVDSSPPPDLFKHILREVSNEVLAAASLQQHFIFSKRDKLELGLSTSGKEPTIVTFRRRADSSLLIIGKEEETALDMLINAMLHRALHYPSTLTKFYAVNLSLGDGIEKYENDVFELLRLALPAYLARSVVQSGGMRDDLPRLLTQINDELEGREEGGKTLSSLYLFFYGLQFAENMLQKGLSRNENLHARDVAEKFTSILRRGPRLGIHTLLWSDKCSSLEAIFGNDGIDFFDYRVALPMSSREDVVKVLERTDAGIPGQKQAFFFSRGKDGFEKFQPYSIPSQEWLQLAFTKIQQKDR